ncbi:MAG: TIGR00266 family protein [Anaerolineales bacterium]|nr:TIGR00266 family protein [Anaerolineales bacterium]
MKVEVLYKPSYSIAEVALEAGEGLNAESGAMVAMSPGVQVETKMKGGFMKSLARSMLGGESFFVNTFRAGDRGAAVMLAPSLPGDIFSEDLAGGSLLVQSGSYLGSSEGVEVSTKWGGAKTFFASEGLIMLRCSGQGTLILSSYGAIHRMDLTAGQAITVDTGHLVAFSEQIQYNVRRVGGLKSTLLSGEGLVVDFQGPGQVLMQTRSEDSFLAWLLPKLPKQSSSN